MWATAGAWLLKQFLAYWPYILGAAGVVGALWWLYSAIYDSGVSAERGRWEAAQRAAEAKAAADTKLLQSAIAEIDTGVTIDLETINAVRVVYRDKVRTVAQDVYRDRPECTVPDRLLEQVNASARDYAAAARSGGPVVRPAEPSR